MGGEHQRVVRHRLQLALDDGAREPGGIQGRPSTWARQRRE